MAASKPIGEWMVSLAEFQKRLIAGSATSGLSGDAIRSLGRLADQLNGPSERLEHLLDQFESDDEALNAEAKRMRASLRERAFLD